jgi:hypothetical protein
MESEGLLLYSEKKPATYLYLQRDKSGPHHSILLLKNPF